MTPATTRIHFDESFLTNDSQSGVRVMRGTRKNGNRTRKTRRSGGKPNPILRAKRTAEFFVEIAQKHESAEKGYRQQLYLFAQRCYGIGLDFMNQLEEFHRFMSDEFWADVRQKPKDDQIMKAVVTFAMNANTSHKRIKVTKIARVLEGCVKQTMEANKVAKYIYEHGGIERLYRELTGDQNKNARVLDDLDLLKQPVEDAEGPEVEGDEEESGWPEEEEESDDPQEDGRGQRARAAPKSARSDDDDLRSSDKPADEYHDPKITDFGGVASPPKPPSIRGRFDPKKHLLVDLSAIGMTPEAAMDLKMLSIQAVVGEPDEWRFRPIVAKSVKQAPRISGLWKKAENEDSGEA
jgi:hypothetical protein